MILVRLVGGLRPAGVSQNSFKNSGLFVPKTNLKCRSDPLLVLYSNANCLSSKLVEFSEFVNEHKPHVIAVKEVYRKLSSQSSYMYIVVFYWSPTSSLPSPINIPYQLTLTTYINNYRGNLSNLTSATVLSGTVPCQPKLTRCQTLST